MSENLEASREKLTALRVKEMEEKSSLELTRFKQDCRKKALELAYQRLSGLTRSGVFDQEIKDAEGKVSIPELLKEEALIGLADKYYNWLISNQ